MMIRRRWIVPLLLMTAPRCGGDDGAVTIGDSTAQASETTAVTPTEPGADETSTASPTTADTSSDPTTDGGPCDTLADCPPEPVSFRIVVAS